MFFRLFSLLKLLAVSLYFTGFVAWTSPAFAAAPKILIYGDSLSAAYGVPQQQGWVALLKEKLAQEKLDYEVINASISGETTSGGLSRLKNTLQEAKPAIVILELGANDGLRGLPVAEMRKNLGAMILLCRQSRAKVLLIGMKIPPNYGPRYTDGFSKSYAELSRQHKTALVPFMLEGIAAKPELIQQDGLHPNTLGQPIMLKNIWPKLKPVLRR